MGKRRYVEKKMPVEEAKMRHTQFRMEQRYGYWMRKNAILKMAELCRCGRYCCHLGEQRTRAKIVIRYKHMLIPLIYDKKLDCIITVLTMNMLSDRERAMVEAAGALTVEIAS